MRTALLLVVLLGASASAQETDSSAGGRAFVEIDLPRETCFVEETVRVRLRIGFDAEYFRAQVVPMFRRELDVPARIDAPWLRSLAGADVLRDDRVPARRLTIAANDEVLAAARADDRSVGGRAFTVIEIERTLVPTEPGDLVLSAPFLHFAHATRIDEDFIRGRTAADRREARIDGLPRTLRVSALPAGGRPPEFAGAVGRFTVSAATAMRAVTAGETFRLVLTIEGEGNLDRFAAPRLDGLPGFHVYGAIDARGAIEDGGARRRAITYDLAALGPEVKEVPAIRFAFFDPEPPGAYRTVATDPIPLTVRAAPSGAPPGPDAGAAEPRTKSNALLVVLAIAAAVGAALAVAWRRARGRGEVDAGALRADGAAAEFRSRTASPGADVADAFAGFLAAHLRSTPAAVIAPDLPARLVAAGVPEGLASRAAGLLERLVAARYGGGAPPPDEESAARPLVDELDAAFRVAARRGDGSPLGRSAQTGRH